MKTATIPHLNHSRIARSIDAPSTNPLTATEEELAQISEATLEQLKHRIHKFVENESENEQSPTSETTTIESNPQGEVDDATQCVVNQILERSNADVPVVLLFVGSEPNHHVDEISARVASALCSHAESRVLLIDSDEIACNLTKAAGRNNELGITEVIEYNRNWRSNVVRNQSMNLDFIPIGKGKFGRWNQQELIRKATCEMKSDYQFVCVSAGDAHGKAAKLWSDVCDGSFLLVSVRNSNGMVAKSAVTELQSNGARLLGCVVTDVE